MITPMDFSNNEESYFVFDLTNRLIRYLVKTLKIEGLIQYYMRDDNFFVCISCKKENIPIVIQKFEEEFNKRGLDKYLYIEDSITYIIFRYKNTTLEEYMAVLKLLAVTI